MSLIKPFKAIRPDEKLADKVAALPYDVMNSDEARVMVEGNPHSFLHVDKAEIDLPREVDLYDPIVYAKARENLDNMIKDGVLITEGQPCFYIYMLTMDGREQNGLVACASIDEYIEGKIKKHELTREDKEQDRIRHVEICDANTGPIFLTYKNKQDIKQVVADWKKAHEAVYDFVSEDGIRHTCWAVDCPETISKIQGAFKTIPALYIADGHHRNASAVKVGLKKREENKNYTGEEEFNSYLAVIFPDDELHIMDYNRIVNNLGGNTVDQFLDKVKEKFTVCEYTGDGPCEPKKRHDFGMYLDGKWYTITAKPEFIDEADPVASLDVSIMQSNLLAPILGIQDPRTDKNIDFVGGIRGLKELSDRVDNGSMKVAFSMFPTSMDELINIADAGKIMPPKSTWFEPKLRSGLFIHRLS